jgi:hypothetical protein
MAIFKRKNLALVLFGKKTQTRRTHKQEWTIGKTYAVRDRWFSKPQGHIVVLRKFRQRLGDISEEDVHKEGYENLADFQKVWTEIYGRWHPDQVITVYEFRTTTRKERATDKAQSPIGSGNTKRT